MEGATRLQSGPVDVFRSLVVEGYAWLVTLDLGAVLLDIVYARAVPEAAAAFSEAGDFLLLIRAVSIVAAIAAIGLAWRSRLARYTLLASLLVSLLGLSIPAFFALFVSGPVGPGFGTGLRIAISGSTSILAFVGVYGFHRQG